MSGAPFGGPWRALVLDRDEPAFQPCEDGNLLPEGLAAVLVLAMLDVDFERVNLPLELVEERGEDGFAAFFGWRLHGVCSCALSRQYLTQAQDGLVTA